MKQIAFKITGAIALLALVAGCSTTATNNTAAINTSQKEMMLTQAGFLSKTVTTTKAMQQVAKLTVANVSAVTYKKKVYYVYPTGRTNQILVGKQSHYDAYKKMLTAHATKAKASSNVVAQQEAESWLTGETAGPNRIEVDEFDGDGPLQNNPMWQ